MVNIKPAVNAFTPAVNAFTSEWLVHHETLCISAKEMRLYSYSQVFLCGCK